MEYRNLDGIYFRVDRDGEWKNVCFSDLTSFEMDEQLKDRPKEWIMFLAKALGKALRRLGDSLDIVGE